MIQFRDTLNEAETLALIQLTDYVNLKDGSRYAPPADADFFFLYYRDIDDYRTGGSLSVLCAAIAVYHMGETVGGKELDEIYAFTLPEFRCRGIFQTLLDTARPMLRPVLRFALYHDSPHHETIRHLGAAASHSEYILGLDFDNFRRDPDAPSVPISLEELPSEDEDAPRMLISCPYGECGIQSFGKTVFLFGMLIYDRWRGKGFGHAFLNEVIDHFQHSCGLEMLLEVSSDNLPALGLYKKAGFSFREGICYYLLEKEALRSPEKPLSL